MPLNPPALNELTAIVGSAHVVTGESDMAAFNRDWRGRFVGRSAAVVRPGCTAEVSAVMAWAHRNGCAIVPQGGNTGLVGGGIPAATGTEIILSLGRMNAIRAVDRVNDTMVVEAGCILHDIQAAAVAAGRLFPLSLASEGSCQIGGAIASNAGGLEVVRYGPMRDLVLGLEVVLPNGDLLPDVTQLRKNNTGYDLKQLFIGSEGTLGIVTAAALKLFPMPRAAATAFCGLRCPADGLDVLVEVKERCGARLSSIEIISGPQMDLVLGHTKGSLPLAARHPWYLLVELTDSVDDGRLSELLLGVLAACSERGAVSDAAIAQSEAQRAAFWALRHMVSESNVHAGRVLSHDTSVPVASGADFISRVEQALSGTPDMQLTFVGHLGDGNVHAVAIFDREKVVAADFEGRAAAVSALVYEISASLGGSISAEHGVGVALRDKLPTYKNHLELTLMRSIKTAIDPTGILNPGKLLVG